MENKDRERKNIYMNPAQRITLLIDAHTSIIVAGRRFGKTHGVIAPKLLKLALSMPGCSIGIIVPSYIRALTNTLPGTFAALEGMGFKRDIHWMMGKKPPKSMNYGKPIIEPQSYNYVMAWFNGTVCYLISQDVPASANSLTLDALIGDEARFLNHRKLKEEIFPANGGTTKHFGDKYCHHSMMFVSDMPVGSKGSWFLNYKEKMNIEVIEIIKGLVAEIWYQEQKIEGYKRTGKSIPAYLNGHLNYLEKKLYQFRQQAVYYAEFSSLYNIEVIGLDYVRKMKRDLPPLTFQTSIMCKRVGIAKDGFYSSMRESHKYNSSDLGELESYDYKFDYEKDATSKIDADVNKEASICIAFDYNANINWLVAGQYEGSRINIIKSFFVKFERKLPELIDDFCSYYRYHHNKTVIYYYDATALGSNYAVNDDDFHEVIIQRFRENGWQVYDVYLGAPMKHMEKHLLINMMFSGQKKYIPYFNEYNNEDLIIAIQTAGVRNGKKYKGGEKLMETEENLLEHRTDGTDAFDTLAIGMETKPMIDNYSSGFISDIITL